jgi:uncharacterized phage protein gp47/JayE
MTGDNRFARPTLTDLVRRAEGEMDSRLPGGDARLAGSVLNVLARVQAGGAHELFGFLDRTWPERFVHSASADFLVYHAAVWGIARVPATAAEGTLTLDGTAGTVIPADTPLQRGDGVEYVTTAEAVLPAAVPVVAVLPGTAGNTAEGVALSLTSPIAGAAARGAVAAPGLTGGEEAEADESLRSRLLTRIQEPPHGGAHFDYVAWALQVAGVTRAWVKPLWMGLGTVGVTFVMDGRADIIPTAEDLAAVHEYLEQARPVTAELVVFAPVPVVVDFDIRLDPNTQAVRDAVEVEIRDLFAREAALGADLLISHVREAVSLAAGEHDHTVLAPSADVVIAANQIAVVGGFTFSGGA